MKKIKLQCKKKMKLEDEIYKLNNENEEILNTLKKEYKKSNLKDTELNVYLEEKNNETKITRY